MEREYCKGSPSYYSILGVPANSSDEEIRRAYRKLAMQWHPDKWTRTPSLLGEAKRRFQQIQEAYSVLSDRGKRIMYDSGLYNPEEEEDEGFADFLQEMMSLVENVRKEDKVYSLEELQSMFWEMAQSFETPDWSINPLQYMYDSPQWFPESSTLNSLETSMSVTWSDAHKSLNSLETSMSVPWSDAHKSLNSLETSMNVPWSDAHKSFETLTREPCPTGMESKFASCMLGDAWDKSFYAF